MAVPEKARRAVSSAGTSARFTRERSLVRVQYRPPSSQPGIPHAEVAEQADALRSGRSELSLVRVQISPSAPIPMHVWTATSRDRALVAQGIERCPAEAEAGGSNPPGRTILALPLVCPRTLSVTANSVRKTMARPSIAQTGLVGSRACPLEVGQLSSAPGRPAWLPDPCPGAPCPARCRACHPAGLAGHPGSGCSAGSSFPSSPMFGAVTRALVDMGRLPSGPRHPGNNPFEAMFQTPVLRQRGLLWPCII